MASPDYSRCLRLFPRQLALQKVPLGLPRGHDVEDSFEVIMFFMFEEFQLGSMGDMMPKTVFKL